MENIQYESSVKVVESNTAAAMGSGDLPVFATPALVALMENAAMLAARQLLGEGETTVGAAMEVKHLAPSLQGDTVTAKAVLSERDGRKLVFTIEANDGYATVGTAVHTRYIVVSEKFLAKARAQRS